jgi:4a-hydroxytetrahydrobiopterin dehydratase
METYSSQQIEEKLKTFDGWALVNDALEKSFTLKNFKEALAFINKVGLLAEEADHHPEIYNVYNKVMLRLNTHSAKGITNKDFDLAEKINLIG